ncbi:UDP-N-acetylglucosamine 1-carboxyvinyltransferase [Desulfobacter postgatei]|jgi:UDP-N-acetylglucosamine 1-carboxyvinyltransferase|uniref:UDP-N-acetylglucosamine 1-carboxyvinyltransferase n=1 Tax=Desulfobacter postgatei TaxID=2293 RepID=UPI002A35844E|nr:UDP-N-acetylglucosamine 1-carboxyvinyltransferase [Desulfobacter postgatei]MDX9962473.1 UDP-N-acetylglucosamine 1-carboxyvinyltransferase [Desulfobacter postgatei]
MDKIQINGGRQLKGEVLISGAKNAALPLIASSILVDGVSTFENVPRLMDISSIQMLLEDLGALCEFEGHTFTVNASGIDKIEAEYELVRKMRASILVLGPLVARFGRAKVSMPGGCAIGARPVNMHLSGLEALGATISIAGGYIEATAKGGLIGNEVYFDIPTVTGTENLMMAAVLAKGQTKLRNAAREPEIVCLADALNRMGANITGAGTPIITIEGVSGLHGANCRVIPDRIETGTFMVAAAATMGDVLIRDCIPDHLGGVINKLRATGAIVDAFEDSIHIKGSEIIKNIDIKTLPYPGFPTDMQAQFMALMTIAQGNSVIHESIFENRFIHANELLRMGADIKISGGNIANVRGVSHLQGAPVMASDLRASASLVIAALIAQGTTVISRVYHMDRGYESIEKKFEGLGADIKRISS